MIVYLAWVQNGPEVTIAGVYDSPEKARDALMGITRNQNYRRDFSTARIATHHSWQYHSAEGTYHIQVMEVK
jgi:hypothetical protein